MPSLRRFFKPGCAAGLRGKPLFLRMPRERPLHPEWERAQRSETLPRLSVCCVEDVCPKIGKQRARKYSGLSEFGTNLVVFLDLAVDGFQDARIDARDADLKKRPAAHGSNGGYKKKRR